MYVMKTVISVVSILLLSACTAGGHRPGVRDEHFETSRDENGAVFFHYRLVVNATAAGTRPIRPRFDEDGALRQPRPPSGPQLPPDPYKMAERVRPLVYEGLHGKLEDTGACPQGYEVLSATFAETSVIEGQCVVP